MQNSLARLVLWIDKLNDAIGRGVSWLTLVMVLITFAVVIFRYVFSLGWVWVQESYVWLHGVVFMMGASYTLLHNGHVRVDIVYRPASPVYKAWVDLFGALLLLAPVIVLFAIVSETYIIKSWASLEESREAGGLPGLFLLKSVIWAFCLLMGLQGFSLGARSILVLMGHREFVPPEDPGPAGE